MITVKLYYCQINNMQQYKWSENKIIITIILKRKEKKKKINTFIQ